MFDVAAVDMNSGPQNLQQRGPLDALHEPPEVAVVAAEVAIPAAARTQLEDHRQRLAVRRFVEPSYLRDERLERVLDRARAPGSLR